MTRPKYSILDSFRFISAVTSGDMKLVLDVFAENPDAWKWREDRDDDFSVLHHAIQARQPAMVDLLIGKGAQLDMGARNAMMPLMLAARTGDAEIVALLLEAGADANTKDDNQHTAHDYAKDLSTADGRLIREWLAEAEANPEKGRIIKSKAGFARVNEMKDVFNKGVGKNQSAPVARFRKKPAVMR